mmetsp:Transcript_29830/g.96242  ORF Transcript_29830/g.96242 Transcript_29830/m.96242 type:complete len:309 (-) Transcript_29830:2326-3252(-)
MASSSSSSWTTIESDPGVFTALIEAFGVKGLEFTELYSLDEESLRSSSAHGLIFLFKYTGEKDDRATCDSLPEGLFCAKQMVNNACATQAILGILLNLQDDGVDLGSTLTELKVFARELPYDMRGLAIENSEAIRTAHNSFARPEPFVSEEKAAKDDDDAFHFVAYVPHRDRKVYELDGLKAGPIDLGDVADGKTWLDVAREALVQRIEKYAASEIKFNLMAVVDDKRRVLEARRNAATDDAIKADIDADLAVEHNKRATWAADNERRRHNYVPLAVDLLKVLAEKHLLTALVDKALTKNMQTQNASA